MPFSSSFSFLFFCSVFVFPLPFVVLRVPLPFSSFLFRSFCLFVISFSVFFLVSPSSLFFSLLWFPWWWILLFCYFVLALHPPRAPCEPEECVFPFRALLSCVLDVDLFRFTSLSSLFSVSVLVCIYLALLFVFPPEVILIFRSRVIGACPVTTDCIVAMS